jgi:hypothetical protein
VKDLIILGMSRAFIEESSFQNVHQKNLLDKAIVKVVNIKHLVSKIVCVYYDPCVKKNLFGKRNYYIKKINWGSYKIN